MEGVFSYSASGHWDEVEMRGLSHLAWGEASPDRFVCPHASPGELPFPPASLNLEVRPFPSGRARDFHRATPLCSQ
ncbi:hypothetical protein GCM10010276_58280 [Streptomyces longisporus]|uniref:Uncharacterized protein n=1 Tax=Streptomyces longisporus TaxID=1948 RepID=A0ABN3MPR0_STRLO